VNQNAGRFLKGVLVMLTNGEMVTLGTRINPWASLSFLRLEFVEGKTRVYPSLSC
jgi:hypothetical protein